MPVKSSVSLFKSGSNVMCQSFTGEDVWTGAHAWCCRSLIAGRAEEEYKREEPHEVKESKLSTVQS